jgi:hypothetical protein
MEAVDFSFSPLPCFSVGMEFMDCVAVFGDNFGNFLGLFPLHAGFWFPVGNRITATAEGWLYWLGGADEKYEPLLNTGLQYSTDEAGNESGSYNGVFITPGIKAGVLFQLIRDALELELSYKGYWFKDRYISTLGLGFVVAP